MVKVSVAMATYNGAKYIREQLDSLYIQTVVPDEIVVCDDCSNDETIEILEEYHQKKGLRYYVNKLNLGVNKNFEKSIRLCKNKYVAICDQDDVWFPNKLEVLLNKIVEIEGDSPCAVSSQTTSLINGFFEKKNIQQECDSVGVCATLLKEGNVQGCTLMINRKLIELLNPFPESYTDVMMYDCYISFVAASCGVKYNIGQVLMAYRHHDANVLGKQEKKKSLYSRVIAKLRRLKNDRIFPSSRSKTLKYIYDEYKNIMIEEAKELITKMIIYTNGNLFERLRFIVSIDYFGTKYKVKNVLLEILMYLLPKRVID